MKTFDEFLTEGNKSRKQMLKRAFIQGNENSETTIAFNPSVVNRNSPTTTAVTAKPKKRAKKVARVLLKNQVEEEVISYPMAKRHTVFNKGRKHSLPPETAMAKRSSSSSGD